MSDLDMKILYPDCDLITERKQNECTDCYRFEICKTAKEKQKIGSIGKPPKRIKFILNGCDISFAAEAPADITLEKLLKQCDRIVPDYCACGIRSHDPERDWDAELYFDYEEKQKLSENVSCSIKPKEG